MEYLKNLFWDTKEGLIIADIDKNVIFINHSAKNLIGNIKNLSDVEHQFSFDLCVLDEENIIKYNPISAALSTKENFKTEAFFQFSQNQYKNLVVKSFTFEKNKAILFSDLSYEIENKELKKQNIEYKETINLLEENNKEYSKLKEKAESQAIRTGLINRISGSIRDILDVDDIITMVIDEISKTLAVKRGMFVNINNLTNELKVKHIWNNNQKTEFMANEKILSSDIAIKEMLASFKSQVTLSFDTGETSEPEPRLVTPVVYHGEILGMILLYYSNQKRSWHQEEIALVEGIATQLAIVINQATLFERLETKTDELTQTLITLTKTQSQLIQSEKMASLGQLVAGVAHEINTPLGAINSNYDIAAKCIIKLKELNKNNDETIRIFRVLDDIIGVNSEAIRRINNIVKTLKNFARLDEAQLNEVDIHEGIRSSLMLINHEIKNRIKIIEDYGNIPKIKCYPDILNQVFMNILVNAYQSIENEGTITIKTQIQDNKLRIFFKDSGKGIAEENLDKIFDPGFTTKGVGVGTGLGLSICYQIIEKHNGSIKVESQPGKGSTFIIELPV